jgi:hypothetical protein
MNVGGGGAKTLKYVTFIMDMMWKVLSLVVLCAENGRK